MKIILVIIASVCVFGAAYFFIHRAVKCHQILNTQQIGNELIQQLNSIENTKGVFPNDIELQNSISGINMHEGLSGGFDYKNKFFVYSLSIDRKEFILSFPTFSIDFAQYSSSEDVWSGTCR